MKRVIRLFCTNLIWIAMTGIGGPEAALAVSGNFGAYSGHGEYEILGVIRLESDPVLKVHEGTLSETTLTLPADQALRLLAFNGRPVVVRAVVARELVGYRGSIVPSRKAGRKWIVETGPGASEAFHKQGFLKVD